MKTMMSICIQLRVSIKVILVFGFVTSCSIPRTPEVVLEDASVQIVKDVVKTQDNSNLGFPWSELFDILDGHYNLNGQSSVGYLMGDANFILKVGHLGVVYNPTGREIRENGVYKNLSFYEDKENLGYNRIEGVWDNTDAGDGYFIIKLLKVGENSRVLLNLEGEPGSGWRYYAERELSVEKYNRLLELLKNTMADSGVQEVDENVD